MNYLKLSTKPMNNPLYYTNKFTGFLLGMLTLMLVSMTLPLKSHAQSQIDEQELLQKYINMAIENNAGLRAGALSIESMRLQSRISGALGDPQLEVEYDIWSRMEPLNRFRFSVMQPVPWFGKLSSTRAFYNQLTEVEAARLDATRNKLVYEIRNTWYELHEWEHHVHITLENLEFLEQLEKQIITRLETGRASQLDVLRLTIEREILKNQLSGFEDRVQGLIGQFNALLNRPANSEIEIQYELQPEPLPERYERQLNFNQNPDIVTLDRSITASETAIQQARLDGRPDFMVGVGLMNRDLLLGDPDRLNTVELMIRMNLPVNRRAYRAREQRARIESQMIEETKSELKNRLSGELQQVQRQLETAMRTQKLYRESLIPLTEQALELALSTYSSGADVFEQIIQLQRQIQEYWMMYNTAVAEHNMALARMDFLTGESPYTF